MELPPPPSVSGAGFPPFRCRSKVLNAQMVRFRAFASAIEIAFAPPTIPKPKFLEVLFYESVLLCCDSLIRKYKTYLIFVFY